MASIVDFVVDFVRERHLNFMIVGVLTVAYLIYNYWGMIIKSRSTEALDDGYDRSRSSSRTRTRSSNDYKSDAKYCRRGRKAHRRCRDCQYEE